ncbi:MAG: DUF885 domain-containing protein [Actinomycetes bacterium]
MTRIHEIADGYVATYAALDPTGATQAGIDEHSTRLTDHSPDGIAARSDLARATRRAVLEAEPANERDRVAAEYLAERLGAQLALEELGEGFRALSVLGGPIQETRMVFDAMAREDRDDWEAVALRLGEVPASLASARAALEEGRARRIVAARRQAAGVARQAAAWAGLEGTQPFFTRLVAGYDAWSVGRAGDPSLRAALAAGADAASAAFAETVEYLERTYLPDADPHDAVGTDRYEAWSQYYNGTAHDLDEAYAWGWEELHRIEDAMRAVCASILPGASIDETMAHLDADPAGSIEGEDAFRAWLQDLLDRSVSELHGRHFDIPERVRRVEAMIAPPGGGAAMYYTVPSEDFSRPGRTWYPTQGMNRFPTWGEVSTCYHEGVPGHHLQCGLVVDLGDALTRFQRTIGWNSGHGEGWALYAERLMGELGYLAEPAHELGMLRAHALRAVRVIIDIGMHLELRVPATEPGIGGEVWTPALGLRFADEHAHLPPHQLGFEVDRYLGEPGQAISYKLGERVWLDARADARRRHGAEFDLRAWHAYALDLGPLGLDLLAEELARF